MLCGNSAMAKQLTCPAGCFCLNNGKIDGERIKQPYGWVGNGYDVNEALNKVSTICQAPAQTFAATTQFACNVTGWYEIYGSTSTYLICDREKYSHYGPNNNDHFSYYMDEFSEMYNGTFGVYGRKNNEIIYFPNSVYYDKMYQCPVSYPISDQGAKTITDCYTYDLNGNKLYYGTKQTILCPEGKYLKANSTTCSNCQASKQQICPGGKFEQSDVIQGLKVKCYPGQYLPANATQCEPCDNNNYLCQGGIYNVGIDQDQGNIVHNGFIAKFSDDITICQPGYYIKANTNACVACTGDYACPGGIFYTADNTTYNNDRGSVLCTYGKPNNNHTECVAQSTSPSFMKEKIEKMVPLNQSVNQQVSALDKGEIKTNSSNIQTTNQNTTNTNSTTEKTDTGLKSTALSKLDFGSLFASPFSTTAKVVKPVSTRSAIPQKNSTTMRSAKTLPPTRKQVRENTTPGRPTQTKERPSTLHQHPTKK